MRRAWPDSCTASGAANPAGFSKLRKDTVGQSRDSVHCMAVQRCGYDALGDSVVVRQRVILFGQTKHLGRR